MTFSVGNVHDTYNSGKCADVLVTYGPVTFKVEESIGSLRAFWSHLGFVLDQAEKDAE